MKKKERKEKEKIKITLKYNNKIEEIASTYPKDIEVIPRERFLNQLRQHLERCKVK